MSSIKREITHFHVVVVLKRERNVQKSVMLVRSCCFAYSTFCFLDVLVVVLVVGSKVPDIIYTTVWTLASFEDASWGPSRNILPIPGVKIVGMARKEVSEQEKNGKGVGGLGRW